MRRTYSFAALGVVTLCLAGTVLLKSDSRPVFSPHEKAFYADPSRVDFVRPGLVIKVTDAKVAADGTITARFKLSDPQGVPLDRNGITTPGAISVSFIAAYIAKGQTQYTAYTVRPQTSPITGVTAQQAGTDASGTYVTNAVGDYTYTFGTRAPKSFDPSVTHAIGIYGSRNLTEFDLGTNYADVVYPFVPNGAKVTQIRDVIRTGSCNQCHQTNGFHGGARKSVELCVLCHQPQTIDPDTGNTVDMAVFIHRIHAGATLPSVQAGKKYIIIGHNQIVSDYSADVFPPDVRNCTKCHEQTGPNVASQATNVFKPNRVACGSCHDNVNFSTGVNHLNLPQVSDNLCAGCHIKQGELDFDASILGGHAIPTQSRALPGVVVNILSVDGAAPGKQPTIVFTIKDKAGNVIKPSDMTRLTVYLTGPNADYAFPGVAAGYLSDTATSALGDGKGMYWWTFSKPLPADAKGSWTMAIEARRDVTLYPGTAQQQLAVRDFAPNQQITFAVDGSKPAPRRPTVSNDKCNACHGVLSLHGGNRNDVDQCPICHNPALTTAGPTGQPAVSLDFKMMVHRIHRGSAATRPLAFGTTTFAGVNYPGDLRNCDACHISGSQQLPTKAVLPVNDPSAYINPLPPTTAACTGCHDTKAASSHAAANTNAGGEACATCHGPSGDQSVSSVHAQ